ncbi:MAG: hypothetical protein ACLGHQ_00375 [Acidimicrobiia bacterium]
MSTHLVRTRLIGPLAIATLALAACGGGGGGQQGEVADMMLASAEEEGIELDDDCVRDVAGRLSDDDAAAIVEAGVDGDPDISGDADALAEEMFDCLDTDAFVDQIVAEMGGQEGLDVDCLKEVLEEQGLEAMDGGAMLECIDLDAITSEG